RIADDGDAFRVARNVDIVGSEEKLGGIVASIEKRMANRAVAVQTLEVQERRARVAQRGGIRMAPQRRSIRRDVVRDELAEDRPAGGDIAKRLRAVVSVAAIADSTRAA